MNLVRFGMIGLLLSPGQQGTAGMIQDPSRVRLVGHCGKLEASAIAFDEQGRLLLDLSSVPPLTAERKKWLCQIKVPFTTDAKAFEGSWHLDTQYKAAPGSRLLSTVRFSSVGEVSSAKIWDVTDTVSGPLAWDTTWSLLSGTMDEQELKITWTSELDTAASTDCPASVELKRLIIAAALQPSTASFPSEGFQELEKSRSR